MAVLRRRPWSAPEIVSLILAFWAIPLHPRAVRAGDDASETQPAAASQPATAPALSTELNAPPVERLRLARDHRLSGRYDEARALCDSLSASTEHATAAACERARVDEETGDYRQGIERLRRLPEAAKRSVEWHLGVASLLFEVGDYAGAIEENRLALRQDGENLRASWQLGQSLERLGKMDEAIKVYRVFEDAMTGTSLPDDAEKLTYLGLGFYRSSVLTSKNLVQRTRHVLNEAFGTASDYLDAKYWPARQAAGELLLAKHNLPDAREEFGKVLAQNPSATRAMVGLGKSYLEEWDFDHCEEMAKAALDVNANDVGAIVLLASLRMTERRYEDAAALAQRALDVNPNSEEAIGVLAAAKTRSGDAGAIAELSSRIRAFNSKPAAFHFALGEWLSAGRQFVDAKAHFEKSIEFAPYWPEPRTSLGQLYMETGDEADARKMLESSFELDSFNQHTFNVLGLLDQVDKFADIESDHFVVKYDGSEDGIVAPYFSSTLESLFADVCGDFKFTPADKTIIELFPDHQGFSVRITGRPFIGTVGACTGRVIAMAAPRGRPPFGRFNWASVLRHEFTHTVTLAATGNRIPHWYTEGLAVYEEHSPRSWSWKQLLNDAVRRDRLFTLQTVDWGFARPRRPDDRSLAYAQSEWMVEYIIERWNYDAHLNLLAAFRDGLSQEAAFEKVLKLSTKQFDEDFRKWAVTEAGKWGLPVTEVPDPEETQKKLKESPDDPVLLATMAQAHLIDGNVKKAKQMARRALKRDQRQPLALEIMCHLLVAQSFAEEKDADRKALLDDATPYILKLLDVDPENPSAIKYIGYVEQSEEQWTEAIKRYKQYQQKIPEDPDSYRRMAAIYLRRGQFGQALEQLVSLFKLSEDEPAVARQVARLYEEREDWAAAAEWYYKAIQIDPYHADTHGALADSLLELGKYADAEREYQVVVKILPDEAIGYEGLSDVYEKLGNLEKAKTYQKRAEALAGKRGHDHEHDHEDGQ